MTLPLARIVILLPVLWLSTCFAASAKHIKPEQVDFSRPVATLATPDRNVAIFRMAGAEPTAWTYMIVRVDEDGTRIAYGDEKTVGMIVKDLTGSLVGTAAFGAGAGSGTKPGRSTASVAAEPLMVSGQRNDHRCTASAGWRFETRNVRVNYCNDSFETARIEHAIELLGLAPDQL